MADLLFEIGVEELPSSYVDAALASLPDLVAAKLASLRLTHGAITPYGTPRRLAVLVRELSARQSDVDEQVVGPPEGAAFKDGKPTRAAEAFAQKLGVPVDSLVVEQIEAAPKPKAGGTPTAPPVGGSAQAPTKKTGRFVVGRKKEQGQPAQALLGAAVSEVAGSIPFRKSMRWGEGTATFGRPVQWLVVLLDSEVIPASFAGVTSGRRSRGHRFLSPGWVEITSAGAYLEQLRQAQVLADRDERARTMMDLVAAAAREAGGVHDPEPSLVDENASLVEQPHVVRGSFERQYLELPAAVIRAVARGHQKYFCVQRSEDELLPAYLAVVNTALAPDKIALGNDRVMRARLADARFFFDEDRKADLEARIEKLAGIVFHVRLGTVRQKVARMEALAADLGARLGLDASTLAQVARAAHLCKGDLVSLMVGEFPELQGHMGRAYARHAGEEQRVADAVRDHYRPVGASDVVAADDVARVVALADRFDTLVGCFAIGLAPTGTADPYALRRACIAIQRTLIEAPADGAAPYASLDVGACLRAAYHLHAQQAAKPLELDAETTANKVLDFMRDRLRSVLATCAGGGSGGNAVADAVLGGYAWQEKTGTRAPVERFPAYAAAKARALAGVVASGAPWLAQARTVAKRLQGIAQDKTPVFHDASGFAASEKDREIVQVVQEIDRVTGSLFDQAAVDRALGSAEDLARRVDAIFVATLVNDAADPLTPKRLELLSYGASCMLRIADFTRLA